ncbi:hypothetical protein L484_005380 [Morus notabilis]|uniref:Uncharacterized protein n=1 Tax=Morus notabilis TaxID=981085 RepID=W9RW81_9ROSA|nr:hypothetical protein L484_005380 [Morus notabilis]
MVIAEHAFGMDGRTSRLLVVQQEKFSRPVFSLCIKSGRWVNTMAPWRKYGRQERQSCNSTRIYDTDKNQLFFEV